MLFAFFRIQLESFHFPKFKSTVRFLTFTSSIISHVTRHVSALDQLKHSCSINVFPKHAVEHAGGVVLGVRLPKMSRATAQFPEEFANF